VTALAVVEDLQALEDGAGQLDACVPALSIKQFNLHSAPERFDHRVAEAITDRAHRREQSGIDRATRERPRGELSIRYTERLAEEGAETSVGSKGDSYDNALAETINGLYKTELIRRRGPWRTVEQIELATAEWVDWWNGRRLHSAAGHVSPAEFEAAHYDALNAPDPAA
jgi:transposase InsO family protein